MKRALVVTGYCRAGGSAVAEVAHVLGYPMGTHFLAPIAPDFRSDWEDAELTEWMAGHVESGAHPLDGFELGGYLVGRERHARSFGIDGRLGFKSPLLSIGNAMDSLQRAMNLNAYEIVVVRVTRSDTAIERSIARQRGADVLRRWNGLIRARGVVPANLVMPYEALMADPELEVGRLALALGVVDPDAVSSAASRVLSPRS